jgi:nucleoside-diphosphate-sugar epimerase
MKIFLTGGTGFIGSNFINSAMKAGYSVIAIRRKGSIPKVDLISQPVWVEGDLEADYGSHLKSCDIFVHMASYGVLDKGDDLEAHLRWNVIATYKLCKQAYEAGINKFIILGSCFEYGRAGERVEFIPTTASLEPSTNYATSKAAASVLLYGWAAKNDIRMNILRIFQVYGEGEDASRLWPSLRSAALSGRDFKMTKGEQIRDFIIVDDVVSDIIASLSFEGYITLGPTITNIGSGEPSSVYQFCSYWWKEWGAKGNLISGAMPYRKGEVMRYVPKIDKRNT